VANEQQSALAAQRVIGSKRRDSSRLVLPADRMAKGAWQMGFPPPSRAPLLLELPDRSWMRPARHFTQGRGTPMQKARRSTNAARPGPAAYRLIRLPTTTPMPNAAAKLMKGRSSICRSKAAAPSRALISVVDFAPQSTVRLASSRHADEPSRR
jgi:hypothetical protein